MRSFSLKKLKKFRNSDSSRKYYSIDKDKGIRSAEGKFVTKVSPLLEGRKLISRYYSKRYQANIIFPSTPNEGYADPHLFVEEVNIKRYLHEIKEKQGDGDCRVAFFLGADIEHSTPIIYIKEDGKEGFLYADTKGSDPDIAQTLAKNSGINVYAIEVPRQADLYSCYTDALIFGRDATAIHPETNDYYIPHLLNALEKKAEKKDGYYVTQLPDELLKTSQLDKIFTNIHHPKPTGKLIHKGKTLEAFRKQYIRKVTLVPSILEQIEGKEERQADIPSYLREKGVKYADLIEIQFYIEEMEKILGDDMTDQMAFDFGYHAKQELKKQGPVKPNKDRKGLFNFTEQYLSRLASEIERKNNLAIDRFLTRLIRIHHSNDMNQVISFELEFMRPVIDRKNAFEELKNSLLRDENISNDLVLSHLIDSMQPESFSSLHNSTVLGKIFKINKLNEKQIGVMKNLTDLGEEISKLESERDESYSRIYADPYYSTIKNAFTEWLNTEQGKEAKRYLLSTGCPFSDLINDKNIQNELISLATSFSNNTISAADYDKAWTLQKSTFLDNEWANHVPFALHKRSLASSMLTKSLEEKKEKYGKNDVMRDQPDNWMKRFEEIEFDKNGKMLDGKAAIREILLANLKNSPSPWNYLLVRKKGSFGSREWSVYYLNDKKGLEEKSVTKDLSLKKLHNLIQNRPFETITSADKTQIYNHLGEYFHHKDQVKLKEKSQSQDQIQKIHSYPWEYHSVKDQAQYIWDTYVKWRLDKGEKVALLYSANQSQAEQLYHYYRHLGMSLPAIFTGTGQARLFKEIALLIEKNNCRDQVHIVPIPTSKHGGDDRKPGNKISIPELDWAFKNVAQHKGAGYTVVSLASKDDHYLIGEGASQGWSHPDEALDGMSKKQYTAGHLGDISKNSSRKKNAIKEKKLKQAYEAGRTKPDHLSLFRESLTGDLIKQFSSANETRIPLIREIKAAIDDYETQKNTAKNDAEKNQNREILWKTLLTVCKKFEKQMDPQLELLRRAILEFDANLRLWPDITTLNQLIIAQQKRDAINDFLLKDMHRLKSEALWSDVLDAKITAYEYLILSIVKSDVNKPVGQILSENSKEMTTTVLSEMTKGAPILVNNASISIQDALSRSRGGFSFSNVTSQQNLDRLRYQIVKQDVRNLLENQGLSQSSTSDYKRYHRDLPTIEEISQALEQAKDVKNPDDMPILYGSDHLPQGLTFKYKIADKEKASEMITYNLLTGGDDGAYGRGKNILFTRLLRVDKPPSNLAIDQIAVLLQGDDFIVYRKDIVPGGQMLTKTLPLNNIDRNILSIIKHLKKNQEVPDKNLINYIAAKCEFHVADFGPLDNELHNTKRAKANMEIVTQYDGFQTPMVLLQEVGTSVWEDKETAPKHSENRTCLTSTDNPCIINNDTYQAVPNTSSPFFTSPGEYQLYSDIYTVSQGEKERMVVYNVHAGYTPFPDDKEKFVHTILEDRLCQILLLAIKEWSEKKGNPAIFTAYAKAKEETHKKKKNKEAQDKEFSLIQDRETTLTNIKAAYPEGSKDLDAIYKKLLKEASSEVLIFAGDWNANIAPLDTEPRNIGTCIAHSKYNYPHRIQSISFFDGGFSAYLDIEKGEYIIKQAENTPLSPLTGRPYEHDDLKPLPTENLPLTQVREINKQQTVMCLDQYYKEEKLVNGELTIFEYEEKLRQRFKDNDLIFRVTKNVNNERGFSLAFKNDQTHQLGHQFREFCKTRYLDDDCFQFHLQTSTSSGERIMVSVLEKDMKKLDQTLAQFLSVMNKPANDKFFIFASSKPTHKEEVAPLIGANIPKANVQ